MEKSGRRRCTDYNLNHMEDLKNTLSLSCNHGFKDLSMFCKMAGVNLFVKFGC